MALSLTTYALAKKYTDQAVIDSSEIAIEEAVDEAVDIAKQYVDEIATEIQWHTVVVINLPPVEEADAHTIYFVPASQTPENDGYFEYLAVDGRWEIIGRTVVDLSNYYTIDEVHDYVAEHAYILPPATATQLGGVIISDDYMTVDAEGNVYMKVATSKDIQDLFQ